MAEFSSRISHWAARCSECACRCLRSRRRRRAPLFLLERKNDAPVALHVDHDPVLGGRGVESFVQPRTKPIEYVWHRRLSQSRAIAAAASFSRSRQTSSLKSTAKTLTPPSLRP